MIIGMDLMTELGLVIDLEQKEIKWEGISIPLKPRGLINNKELLNAI